MRAQTLRDERGFTLVELLVASVCTIILLGGAVALSSQIQNGYRRQIEDSAGEQEARYALEWVNRYLRSVGNNPFNVTQSDCPGANTTFYGLIMQGLSRQAGGGPVCGVPDDGPMPGGEVDTNLVRTPRYEPAPDQ